MQNTIRQLSKKRMALSVAAVTLTSAMGAQALDFEFADGEVQVDWDTQLSYGAMWRVQSAAPNWDNLASSFNTNDGTLNFDTGIVSNKISMVSEADIRWRNFGFFVRGKAFYDAGYENQDTDMSEENFFYDNSGDGGGEWTTDILGAIPVGGALGTLERQDFHEDTLDIHGKDAFFLDAFLYGDFEVGGKFLSARLGRQVISWGESLFFPNTSGAQSHPDAAAAAAPGTQLKEIFMPVGALYGNLEVSSAISVEAYYQYEWKQVKQSGVGSYWSNADVSGAGAERLILFQEGTAIGDLAVPTDIIREDRPEGTSEEAQWGVAMRYFLESGTEFGFYGLRYHDKYFSIRGLTDPAPAIPQVARFPAQFQDHYQQDIDLYAVSFSTLVGDLNIVGELSYSPNSLPTQNSQPAALDATGEVFYTPDFVTAHVTQANFGVFYIWGKTPLADQISLLGEAVYIRSNLDDDVMPDGVKLINDDSAWGYAATLQFDYKSVVAGLDLQLKTAFKHAVEGDWKVATLTNNAKEASIGVDFKYLTAWKGGIKYAEFWGAEHANTKHDRDNISFSVTYSF